MTPSADCPPDTATWKVLVVMGVSGSGKSTLAARLAQALNWDFLDGDDLHPPGNVAKMRAGVPLQDADRWPWLDAIAAWIARELHEGRHGVVACSALRRVYRDRLRAAGPGVGFIYLAVPHGELVRRLHQRRHFMPPSLLDSQLATLEEPDREEPALRMAADGTVAETLACVLRALERQGVRGAAEPRPRGRS